jgi:hypothetical protein
VREEFLVDKVRYRETTADVTIMASVQRMLQGDAFSFYRNLYPWLSRWGVRTSSPPRAWRLVDAVQYFTPSSTSRREEKMNGFIPLTAQFRDVKRLGCTNLANGDAYLLACAPVFMGFLWRLHNTKSYSSWSVKMARLILFRNLASSGQSKW